MIKLTQLNKQEIIINCDLILHVEENPHTVIKMLNSDKYLVEESAQVVVDKIVSFKSQIIKKAKED